jgi:hypothetical protein
MTWRLKHTNNYNEQPKLIAVLTEDEDICSMRPHHLILLDLFTLTLLDEE